MRYRPYYDYPARTICDVLAEMRKAYESRNFAGILGLVEEVQTLANRMEAALEKNNQLEEIEEKRKEAKAYLRELEAEIKKLEDKKDQHEKD